MCVSDLHAINSAQGLNMQEYSNARLVGKFCSTQFLAEGRGPCYTPAVTAHSQASTKFFCGYFRTLAEGTFASYLKNRWIL